MIYRFMMLVLVLIAACEPDELTRPVPAEPVAAAATSVEVPPEFERAPSIIRVGADAGFTGREAYGIGWVNYFGNRARIDLQLHVKEDFRDVAKREVHREGGYFLPDYYSLSTRVSTQIRSYCGHVAEAIAKGAAWHRFLLKFSFLEWGREERATQKSAKQPTCDEDHCDMPLLLDPAEEQACEERRSGSGGDPDDLGDAPPSTDGLDCETAFVLIWVDGDLIYAGEATICE